jgi:copper(I)-binding protein
MVFGRTILNLAIAAILSAAAVLGSPAASAHEDGLSASDAWVRMAPPVLKTHGAYLTITNHGADPGDLIGAASGNYGEVQMHLSQIVDGVATMQRLESVAIPAGQTVEFKPGGLHFMLIGAKAPLEEGKSVPITLSFRSGETIGVEAMVMKSAPSGGDTKEMDHSGHECHHTH